ncbi:hypothetical protein HKCCE2091_11185 [Rhodobacterales bacterium HKCCE2091]|nr:hypothetical protein [Rhodobacterales bacterium HKCCE2091]
MLNRIAGKARAVARAAAFSAAGGFLILVGIGFLTVSAWIALSAVLPLETVALIIGGAYVGLGAISIGIAAMGREPAPRVDTARRPAMASEDLSQAVMQSFLMGMTAGQGAAHRKP